MSQRSCEKREDEPVSGRPIPCSEEFGSEVLNLLNEVLVNECKLHPSEIKADKAKNLEEIYQVNPNLQRFLKMDEEKCSLSYDLSTVRNGVFILADFLLKENVHWPPFIWINFHGPEVSTLCPIDMIQLKTPNRGRPEFQLSGFITGSTDSGYETFVRKTSGYYKSLRRGPVSGCELMRLFSSGSVVSVLYGFTDYTVLQPVHEETSKLTLSEEEVSELVKLTKKNIFLSIKEDTRQIDEPPPETLLQAQIIAARILQLGPRTKFELTEEESSDLAQRLRDKKIDCLDFRNSRFVFKKHTACSVCLRPTSVSVGNHCYYHIPEGTENAYSVYLSRPLYNSALAYPYLDITAKDYQIVPHICNVRNKIRSRRLKLLAEICPEYTKSFSSKLTARSYLRRLVVCNLLNMSLQGIPMTSRAHLGDHLNDFIVNGLDDVCAKFNIRIQLGNFESPPKLDKELALKYGVYFPAPGTYDKQQLVYTRVHTIDGTKNLIYVGKNSRPSISVSDRFKYYEPGEVIQTSAVVLTPSKCLLPALETATQVAYVLAMCLGLQKYGKPFVVQNQFLDIQTDVLKGTTFIDYVKLIFLYEFNHQLSIEKLE